MYHAIALVIVSWIISIGIHFNFVSSCIAVIPSRVPATLKSISHVKSSVHIKSFNTICFEIFQSSS
ncbi:MAG: hypothetical protein WCG25_09690 [bacterium]